MFSLKSILVAYLSFQISIYGYSNYNQEDTLKIVSWNIYMLPKFIKNTGKIERAKKIVQYINDSLDVDVIVFQEAFHKKCRNIILNGISKKYAHAQGPANRKVISLKTNSGLLIISKHPICESHAIRFENRLGIDAFSRKGGMIVEINVNGKTVQIVGTHLQSAGDEKVKIKQCNELKVRLIIPYSKPNVPQIICGDFNIDKHSEHYNKMVSMLDLEDGELDGETRFTYNKLTNDLLFDEKEAPSQIDHILLNKDDSFFKKVKRKITPAKNRWHPKHEDLSDHYPLQAEMVWNNDK